MGGCRRNASEVELSVANVVPFQHYGKLVYVCLWETHGVTSYGEGWRKAVVNLCLEFRCIYFVVYHNIYFRPQPLFVFAFFFSGLLKKDVRNMIIHTLNYRFLSLMCSPCNDQR